MKITSRTPLTFPKFLRTELLTWEHEDKSGTWELVLKPNSVHVLVDNTDLECLLLVEQPRIPVVVTTGLQSVIEVCAGVMDKQLPPQGIAVAEVHEELGFYTSIDDLISYGTLLSSVGTSGSVCHLFSCKVTNHQFVGQNLSNDEFITTYTLPYKLVHHFINTTTNTDPITKHLLSMWLFDHPQYI